MQCASSYLFARVLRCQHKPFITGSAVFQQHDPIFDQHVARAFCCKICTVWTCLAPVFNPAMQRRHIIYCNCARISINEAICYRPSTVVGGGGGVFFSSFFWTGLWLLRASRHDKITIHLWTTQNFVRTRYQDRPHVHAWGMNCRSCAYQQCRLVPVIPASNCGVIAQDLPFCCAQVEFLIGPLLTSTYPMNVLLRLPWHEAWCKAQPRWPLPARERMHRKMGRGGWFLN